MKFLHKLIVCCGILLIGNAKAIPYNEEAQLSSAPIVKCEFPLSTWCIAEGAHELTRTLADDSVHDRFWSLSGPFLPESRLIILEPPGCKQGLSDTLYILSTRNDVSWHKAVWSEFSLRLKRDGSCDLTFLVPAHRDNPMEWALSTGLTLVRSCKDSKCIDGSLGDLRAQLVKMFKTTTGK